MIIEVRCKTLVHELALLATSYGSIQHVVHYKESNLDRVFWACFCFESALYRGSCHLQLYCNLSHEVDHVFLTNILIRCGYRLAFFIRPIVGSSLETIIKDIKLENTVYSFATQNLFTEVRPQNWPEHFDHDILTMPFYPRHIVPDLLSVTFCPMTFCPHIILSATFCPWHFVRWHFVRPPA